MLLIRTSSSGDKRVKPNKHLQPYNISIDLKGIMQAICIVATSAQVLRGKQVESKPNNECVTSAITRFLAGVTGFFSLFFLFSPFFIRLSHIFIK